MSIIVRGMEMPSECTRVEDGEFVHCPFVNTDDDCILQSKATGTWEEMYQNCPMIALPDHHGRLVDADALIADCQLAQKQADRHGREFANAFYSGGGEISTEWWCVEDMIENAPTIVEAEGET